MSDDHDAYVPAAIEQLRPGAINGVHYFWGRSYVVQHPEPPAPPTPEEIEAGIVPVAVGPTQPVITEGPLTYTVLDDGMMAGLSPAAIRAKAAELAAAASDPVPETISDRQFSQYLAETGEITWDQHEAWVGPGVVPAPLLAAVENIPDDSDEPHDLTRRRARSFLIGATSFERHHPATLLLLQLMGKDAAWADQAWRTGATL